MSPNTQGRAARWILWGIGAIAAGAIKPLFFPAGGWIYAVAALSLIFLCAIAGILIERAISNTLNDRSNEQQKYG